MRPTLRGLRQYGGKVKGAKAEKEMDKAEGSRLRGTRGTQSARGVNENIRWQRGREGEEGK